MVLNTTKSAEEIRERSGITAKLALVDASRIAMETMGIPITNTTLLGAMLKATDLLPLSALEGPLEERFGRIAGEEHPGISAGLPRDCGKGVNNGERNWNG